jgi:quinol monooxygenase YgiN
MIIILGYITARSETIDELMVLGLEHTRRSRLEPGCLSHDVSRDVENPNRLLFIERWADLDAVRTHHRAVRGVRDCPLERRWIDGVARAA